MREIIAQYGRVWIAVTVWIGIFGLLFQFPFGGRSGVLSYAGSYMERQQEKDAVSTAFDTYWRENEKYHIGDDGDTHSD